MAENEIKKGLAGVVVDYTAVSKVNPDTNSLLYRGYPVQELAAKCSFEEVAYLLWNGELPHEGPARRIHRAGNAPAGRWTRWSRQVIDALPTTAHPMDVCRTAASVMGARHPLGRGFVARGQHGQGHRPVRGDARGGGLRPAPPARAGPLTVEPRDDLGYSANFLWMSFGEEPVQEVVEAFNVSMILYAEHSFNASTFTARVITSTLSDLHSAVTGAIGALKGPLHGGANEAVMHTFDEIGIRQEESLEEAAARAKAWMEDALAQKKKVMGFGHRVYKHGDSRVPTMKAALDKMVAHYGRPELLGLYNGLETAMDEAKAIKPNLDYPAGPTYHLMGFDTPTFTPLFVASRITGWTAHIMEQLDSNSLIRPLSEYNGVEERHVP